MPVNARFITLVVLLLFGFASFGVLRWRASQSDSPPIGKMEQEIPAGFGPWTGVDVPIEDDTIRVLDAYSFINRLYSQSGGPSVSLHAANWQNENTIAPAPHHPEVCYRGAGWRELERRTVQCPLPDEEGEFPVELILFERNGERVVTGHWFQTGPVRYVSAEEFGKYRSRFWGTSRWPGTEKFLLQCQSGTIESAKDLLLKFSQDLLEGMKAESVVAS